MPCFFFFIHEIHSRSLEAKQTKLSKLTIPITILQGTDDTLVAPESAIYAAILFQNSDLKVEWIKDAGHIINLQHPDKVIEAIQEMNTRSKQQ